MTTPFEDLQPVRQHRWEEREDGRVTVFVPRFTSGFARRWLVPLFARPEYRMHLDETGSFVWLSCDGTVSVREVAARLAARTGTAETDALAGTVRFVRRLVHEESLAFHPPGEPAAASPRPSPDGRP